VVVVAMVVAMVVVVVVKRRNKMAGIRWFYHVFNCFQVHCLAVEKVLIVAHDGRLTLTRKGVLLPRTFHIS
jgi:hypothetical protein